MHSAVYTFIYLHCAFCTFSDMEEEPCSSSSGDKKSERMDRLRMLHLRRVCIKHFIVNSTAVS